MSIESARVLSHASCLSHVVEIAAEQGAAIARGSRGCPENELYRVPAAIQVLLGGNFPSNLTA